MHLRFFIRGKKKYYFIAETSRKGKKIIQKYLLYVGTADTLYKRLIKLKKN